MVNKKRNYMARIAGITIERTNNGQPKSITFDYKKYGQSLQRFFEREGLENPASLYNKKEVELLLNIKSEMKLGKRKKVNMLNFWDE